jgi:acyl carrier protein
MNASADALVRELLSLRLWTPPDRIQPRLDLRRDLGMDPLDLVLVALDLEEIEGDEFPVADLESVRTVADLERLVRIWLARPTRQRDRPTPLSVAALRRRLRRATREWRHDSDPRRRLAR